MDIPEPSPSSPLSSGVSGSLSAPPNIPGYTLHQRIGAGSYGEVWLAQSVLGEWRAVKIVRRDKFEETRPYDREFEGLSHYAPISLLHPSLLRVLHVGREDAAGYFYCVMELADDSAEPVSNLENSESGSAAPAFQPETYTPRTLKRELQQGGRLPLEKCLIIGLELVTALAHLHSCGLVHRDVKPSNIVFVRGEAKLADIGLVAMYESTASIVGAEGYMPSLGASTPQADLFALGKVLYEMSTGLDRLQCPRLPDLGKLPASDRKAVLELNRVILKACHPSPKSRYQSAADLKADLLLLQEGSSLRLRRQLKVALVALAVLVVVLSVALLFQRTLVQAHERKLSLRLIRHLSDAQAQRQGVRSSGWFASNWTSLGQAGKIRWTNEVADQVATAVAGVDVAVVAGFSNIGGSSLVFNSDGQLLAGGLTNRPAMLWSPQTPAQLQTFTTSGDGPVCFDSTGTPLQFVPQPPDRFVLREAHTGRVRQEFRLVGDTGAGYGRHPVLAVSFDGSRVAAAVTNGGFAVWDATTGDELVRRNELVTALAFSPDGTCLATGDADGHVVVRSLPGLAELARWKSRRTMIHCLAFALDLLTPDEAGKAGTLRPYPWLLAAGDGGGTITVWEVATQRLKSECFGSHYDVLAIAFNPDGTLLASAGRRSARLWDVATGQPILNIDLLPGLSLELVRAAAFSADGGRLAFMGDSTFGYSPSLVILKLDVGRGIATLRGLRGQVSRVWWSSNGRRLAGLAHDWSLGVWEVASGRLLRVFEVPKGDSADNAAVAFFPDGRALAYTSGTAARIYDIDGGRMTNSLQLEPGLADHLRYLDEGRMLLLRREAGPGQPRPRTWRVRNLLGPEPGRIVHEQQDTNWWAYNMLLPMHGDRFLVWNRGGPNGETASTIHAFGLSDGLEKWPKVTSADQADMACDPTGESGVYNPGGGSRPAMLRLSDGDPMPGLNQQLPQAMYSALKRYAAGGGSKGGCLFYSPELPSEGVRLAMDWRMALRPEFSPNGKLLAWGTENGLVLVADLDEVLRRLEQLRRGR